MPRALTDNGRVELRLRPEDKATLTRAASLKRLDLTGYILGALLPKAEAERLTAPERDSLRVLALLEDPPSAPNRLVRARLIDAALVRVALSSGRSRNSMRPLSVRARGMGPS